MQKNDIITLKIEDISNEGSGIGHVEGMTVFVNGTVIGDEVEAVIIKAKKNYCIGKLRQVIVASVDRVESKCPVADKCGGCLLQHLSYAAQLKLKQKIVTENLVRIGGVDREYLESITEPIIGMDEPFRYRNKAQIPVGVDKFGNTVMGYYAKHSHRIIECEDCLIGQEVNGAIMAAVKTFMEQYNIPAYDEENGRGLVRHVLIRQAMGTGQLMVCLVINGTSLPKKDLLVERLRETIDSFSSAIDLTSVCLNYNTRRDNVIMSDRTECIYGEEFITDIVTVAGKQLSFNISANSFYQVNHDQMEKLYGAAVEYADLTGEEIVWDLYCGAGTITLSMANRAKEVYGVEVVPQAIENAKSNAKLNNITNAYFQVGKAEEVFPDSTPDVVVVDPPRKGCDEKCLETIVRMSPDRIVYVSCDSATLARDVKYLTERGYKLDKVRAVEQFCHSMHVEVVCLLIVQTP